MKRPIVFSLLRDQSIFMTAIMSLLTFLSVMALGTALAIGTGVVRWNTQWDLFATVQIMDAKKSDATKKIINDNRDKIVQVTEITTDEMTELMRPWVSGGAALKNYLPQMYELQFKTTDDLAALEKEISKHARFLTHATALQGSTSAGWQMILIAGAILALTLGAIGVCISYIARNTAMLHRRELEILNQIGATDSFVARQMQIIVGKISISAAGIGFVAALPVLALVMSAASSARVGLMAMMTINGFGWLMLICLPIAIVIFALWITRRTTLKILQNS